MNTIIEPAKELPVTARYDVIVCGGGPSGFIAAIASARMGARTLLVEHYGFLGGLATAGMVGPISKFNFNGRRIVGGIPLSFIEACAAENGAILDYPSGNVPFDAEVYKKVSLAMCSSAGVAMLFHTTAAAVLNDLDDRRTISHVILENKSGRQAVAARYVIDCTATGDILSRSGAACELRGDDPAALQPMSLVFRLGGVDTDALDTAHMRFDKTRYSNPLLREALSTAVKEMLIGNFGGPWTVFGSTIRKGELTINATRIGANASDGNDRSRAEVILHHDMHAMAEVFRKAHPAFARCYIIDSAAEAGARETRRAIGLYTVEADDLFHATDFPDTIALGGHPLDMHKADDASQEAPFLKAPYHIPYRALVPKGSNNLIVAGSLVSASKEAYASMRVQAQCMAMGEAAGTAAALCAEKGIRFPDIDGIMLRNTLNDRKCITSPE